jgi:hypothetical protein
MYVSELHNSTWFVSILTQEADRGDINRGVGVDLDQLNI